MPPKALSLYQPWASLIALSEKHYETRHWPTNYRGPVVIHATKKLMADTCAVPLFRGVLRRHGFSAASLPLGAGLCIADLVEIVPTEQIRWRVSDQERSFGNFADGRFAWKFVNVRLFSHPILFRGNQGLWDWNIPYELAAR